MRPAAAGDKCNRPLILATGKSIDDRMDGRRRLEGPDRRAEHKKIVLLNIHTGWFDRRCILAHRPFALHEKTRQSGVLCTVGHLNNAAVDNGRRDMLCNMPGVSRLRMVDDADLHTD